MSKIAIVVPVYSVEQYIHKCIDSILTQTFKDFELILVDDGSPDNCPSICDNYAKKDGRIHVIHQKNGGLSAARNAGIDWFFKNSISQWITFIDSDDWIHPKMLEVLYHAAVSTNCNVSICGYYETEGDEPLIDDTEIKADIWNTADFFVQYNTNAIVAWGKLYNRECFKNIRYPVGKIHEDEYVTYRILFNESTITYLPYHLYFYRIAQNSITRSKWSIKRLDGLKAKYEQLCFFHEHKLNTVLMFFVPIYLFSILGYFNDAEKEFASINLQTDIPKLLKVHFRRVLKKYKVFVPLTDYIFFYEFAFPKKMKIYWLYQSIIKKLKAMFGVNNAQN